MDNYTIREAQVADISELMRLINVAYDSDRYFKSADRVQFTDIDRHLKSGKFVVLERNGSLVAAIYIEITGRRGYFGLLAVDPKEQRRGLGKRLVELAEDRCREAGCDAICLKTVSIRKELRVIYRKMGYLETGTEPWDPHQPLLPGFDAHFVCMEKKL